MLVFLIIIGVSFAVMASRLTGFVSDYLYQQRIREDSLSVEKLATTVAPLFQSASGDALNETLHIVTMASDDNAAVGKSGKD